MNIQTSPPLTAAEQQLLDAHAERVKQLPGNAEIVSLRDRLMEDVRKSGLPTRRIEAWHYTDLRAQLRSVPDFDDAAYAVALPTLVDNSHLLSTLNGVTHSTESIEGLTVASFAAHLSDGSALSRLEPTGPADAVARINGAFVSDGFVLNVAPEAALDLPIEMQAVHGDGQSHTRHHVTFGARSSVTVIERHIDSGEGTSLSSHVTDLDLDEGANVTWIIVQQTGMTDSHLGQLNFTLGKDAKLTLIVLNSGGKLVRQEINGKVDGEGADFVLRGINLLGGDSLTDVTMVLDHSVPNTTSSEIIRNVVFDKARGVFQGQIRVAAEAQKTDAKMACNTLLLSDDGDFSAKPELEIFADDVLCGHGATVADIDDNHLFYMMARGIPERIARAMLVYAFLAEIVEELEDDKLVTALEGIIDTWLEGHA